MAQPLHLDKNLFDLTIFNSQKSYFIAHTDDNKLLLYKKDFKYPFLKLNSSSNYKKTALCFFDTDTVVSGDADGNIEFISICTNSSIKTIHLFTNPIKQIVAIPDTNYLIVHASTDILSIIDAKEQKKIQTNIKKSKQKIKNIQLLNSENLMLTLRNNSTIYLELPSSQTLKSLVLHNSIKEAFELIEEEPILQNTSEAKKLGESFNKAYRDAIDALSVDNNYLANSYLEIYKDIPSKKNSLKLLFDSFKYYDRFKALYKEKKYAICYAISSTYTPLQMTSEYIKMEKKWNKLSIVASSISLSGDTQSAKKILREYITISSKRTDVQKILLNKKSIHTADELEMLQNFYEDDKFFACYEHIDRYPKLYHSELGNYLQKHYFKLISMCENYAIDANIDKIKTTLGELITLKSRKDRVDNILKIAFLVKIDRLLSISHFKASEELIYSYIDNFGSDSKISTLMKEYEGVSCKRLAITVKHNLS